MDGRSQRPLRSRLWRVERFPSWLIRCLVPAPAGLSCYGGEFEWYPCNYSGTMAEPFPADAVVTIPITAFNRIIVRCQIELSRQSLVARQRWRICGNVVDWATIKGTRTNSTIKVQTLLLYLAPRLGKFRAQPLSKLNRPEKETVCYYRHFLFIYGLKYS